MFVEQFVDEGLGNSAYLVGSEESRLAALIDPLRDVDRYLAAARARGLTVSYVLETHLHADFVSGAREAAARVGATIAASAQAGLHFEHRRLTEGDHLMLGELTLQVLATPGHTPEHISFIATAPAALFSGGALIVGGAARTDLLGDDLVQPLARQLFHTIHDKILALPDSVTLYPTHGAGSFCVAPTSTERVSTIGEERHSNPLAQARTEEEFVAQALTGLPSYPTYYREMRPINQRGPKVLGGLPALAPLAPTRTRELLAQGVSALDVRPARQFAAGHIPSAYGISLATPLVTWAGWLIPFGAPLVLIAPGPREREEAVRQLIRIGYDDLRGYLEGGMEAWAHAGLPVERFNSLSAGELRERLGSRGSPLVLDVRQDSEWHSGHIPGATHLENGRLAGAALTLPSDQTIAIHCQHGPRAAAGASVLARRGYRNLFLVEGGFAAWEEAGYPIERTPGSPT